jgi:8-oxo-dGTP pyrophosphatase MutT (NUDIX family)
MSIDRTQLPFRVNCEGYFIIKDEHSTEVRILAMNTNKGYMLFPGGGVDKGETPIQAITRETFEETGAILSNIKQLGKVEFIWDEDWAVSDKQKRRYTQFKGEEMHFYTGEITHFEEIKNIQEDTWQGEKLMNVKEVIKAIEDTKPFSKDIKPYREAQLKYLTKF